MWAWRGLGHSYGPCCGIHCDNWRDGARITSQNHKQPPHDWGIGQDVNDLLLRKGLVDQLRQPSSHTWWSTTLLHSNRHFVTSHYDLLLHITAYLRALAWSHSRTRRRRTRCHSSSIGLACPSIWTDRVKRSFKRRRTIPDVFWAQHKQFYPGRASKDQVLLVVSKIFLVRKQPALQTLVSPVNDVTDWPAVCRKCGCGPLPASVITYYYY